MLTLAIDTLHTQAWPQRVIVKEVGLVTEFCIHSTFMRELSGDKSTTWGKAKVKVEVLPWEKCRASYIKEFIKLRVEHYEPPCMLKLTSARQKPKKLRWRVRRQVTIAFDVIYYIDSCFILYIFKVESHWYDIFSTIPLHIYMNTHMLY